MVLALLVALSTATCHAAMEIASSPSKSASSLVFNGAVSGTAAGNAALAHFIYANNGVTAGGIEPPTPTTTAPEPASMAKFAAAAALGMVGFVMFRRKLSAV
jgi:hypothetical protein